MSILLTALGASMVASSAYGIHRNMPSTHLKIQVKKYLEANKLHTVRIRNFNMVGDSYRMELSLPYDVSASDLQEHVPGLEQVTSSFVKYSYAGGPVVVLEFGFSAFAARMNFRTPEKPLGPLCVPMYSPFGTRMIDFNDETCCHMLVGGTTRMGKSVFIRLMVTMLLHTTQGDVVLKLLDNKINDLYVFRDIPGVELGETQDDAKRILSEAVKEMERRKGVLKEVGDCVDMKDYRKNHPNSGMPPYFVIIDEYARFSDNEEVQKLVETLVETAGYLDMHMVVASQRPDAQTVLRPRIKANLLTRVCFTTADKKNSEVILDSPDAVNLRRIQGRAILNDGFNNVVQVPYLSTEQAAAIIKPYKKEGIYREYRQQVIESGSESDQVSESLQGFRPRAIGEDDLQEPEKLNTNRKSRAKKARA